MKSGTPKVLHPVCGRPMLEYVLDLTEQLCIKRTVAVLGFKHAEVRKYLRAGIKPVIQKRLLGTADAVKTGLSALKGFQGTVVILYGDTPLLKKETVKKLLDYHIQGNADATLLTATPEKCAGYGRILRDKYSSIAGIVEEKDADDFQKEIREVNTGISCFNKKSLDAVLKNVRPNNRKKEYYLTDCISLLYKNKGLIDGIKLSDIDEAMGINSRVELAKANRLMQSRINEEFMKHGVSIVDPATSHIAFGTRIGQDTVIYPFTVIERNVKIGKCCSVGPFARLREGTELCDNVSAGSFLETVRSKLGPKTLAKHFGYLGDSRIGSNVNVGAGTVVANFDGKKKNLTAIGDRAFIGSDTVIVAPVKIGRGARTGAGSVVTRDVPAGETVAGVPAKAFKKRRGKR